MLFGCFRISILLQEYNTLYLYALVIAPVRVDSEYELKMKIIRSICDANGLGYRLPLLNSSQFDLDAAMETIRSATVIVADLSYARPSCYYELGLAEGANRQVSLIARAGSEIFQHSGKSTVAFYDALSDYEVVIAQALGIA
jgi:hypothetical protein